MSYCRFSEGDVYAYACEGGVQFWVAGKTLDRLCETYDAAYQYAKYLRDECGLDVPSHAIDALKADALDESNHGDGSAVAELVSENAKLRELLSMYMTFARTAACGLRIRNAYVDGMGRKLDEAELRERAMELGIERCR